MNEVVVVGACRTAIGKFLGSLKDVPAKTLAITAGKEAIKRAGVDPSTIDEIVMGQVYQHMQDSLPARAIGLACGLPHRSAAMVVNQNCASAMRATEIAANKIMLGKTEIALVVGVENMTRAPFMLQNARTGYRMGSGELVDSLLHDALYDALVPGHMGMTAENVAQEYGITREECDQLALMSHQRASKAVASGAFEEEIVPVELKTKKGVEYFTKDEHFIPDANLEAMGKLKPAFKPDGGVVTAANASGINDGAAALVLMSKKKAEQLGLKPMAKLVNIVDVGVEARVMGLGPAVAIPQCLNEAGLKASDIDYWEINEAFAPQFIGCERKLKKDFSIEISRDKINHYGSGIALGHPIGCTGVRIVVTLLYEMKRKGYTYGCASLCVGTGPAMASIYTTKM
jgi:acetyl-CoA C-acetyltransferase